MIFNPTYKLFGDKAILIEWPVKIDEKIIEDIVAFELKISNQIEKTDSIIAYNSLTINFHTPVDFNKTVKKLKELYKLEMTIEKKQRKLWQIPVCYGKQFGLDLEEISQTNQISIEEIVKLHTKPHYLIYFIGFQPGFLYLGGLNEKIHVPRKANPRLRVAKGSVGIGGKQTGIYPSNSAGGWNLIGKSPINFFDINKSEPCFAQAGDKIQFKSVDLKTFLQIEKEIKQGTYQIKFQEL